MMVLVVHLLNYLRRGVWDAGSQRADPSRTRGMCARAEGSHSPLSNLEPGGKVLQWSYNEHVVTVWVPEIEIHAMVVIR